MPESAHILVVDDIASNRMVASLMLNQLGFRTTEAANGPDTIAILENQPIDVVLLDRMLGEECGFDVCRTIRQMGPQQARIPLIIVSADSRLTHRVVQDRGANDLILKPIMMNELDTTVRKWLGKNLAPEQTPKVETNRPFDSGYLDSMGTGEFAHMRYELLDVFAREAPKLLARGRAALAAGDAVELRLVAHSLKGASLAVGGNQLASLASTLEATAIARELAVADAQLAACNTAYEALQPQLDDYRNRMSG